MKEHKPKEWYKHGWGLVAAVLFLPFFIIWYAWAKSNWNKSVKIAVTVGILVFVVAVLASNPEQAQQTAKDKPTIATTAANPETISAVGIRK